MHNLSIRAPGGGCRNQEESSFRRTSGSSLYQISKAERSIATTAMMKYAELNTWVPSWFTVVWGRSIMIRLMMLTPCANDTRYHGHTAWVLRMRICTREMTTRKVSSTGSHHSCVFTDQDDTGKIRSGTTWKHITTGITPRMLRTLRMQADYHRQNVRVEKNFRPGAI